MHARGYPAGVRVHLRVATRMRMHERKRQKEEERDTTVHSLYIVMRLCTDA